MKKNRKATREVIEFGTRIWIQYLWTVIDQGKTEPSELIKETDRRFLQHLIEDRTWSPDRAIELRYKVRAKIAATSKKDVVDYLIDYAKQEQEAA